MRDRRRSIGCNGRLSGALSGDRVDSCREMEPGDHIDRRVERAAFETDRQLVVGDITLPPTGYQSRFSDSINRVDLEFVLLTNVEITSLVDGTVSERPFVALSKRHIRLSYPTAE